MGNCGSKKPKVTKITLGAGGDIIVQNFSGDQPATANAAGTVTVSEDGQLSKELPAIKTENAKSEEGKKEEGKKEEGKKEEGKKEDAASPKSPALNSNNSSDSKGTAAVSSERSSLNVDLTSSAASPDMPSPRKRNESLSRVGKEDRDKFLAAKQAKEQAKAEERRLEEERIAAQKEAEKKEKRKNTQNYLKDKMKGSVEAEPKANIIAQPPQTKLEGNKWIVEYYEGVTDVVVSEGLELKHTVYIFKCKNSVVTIKGKCNAVMVDNCLKTNVIFDTAISSLDIVNCKNVKVQVNESVSSVQVDNTSAVGIYLPTALLPSVQIYTSKSTEVNLNIPLTSSDDGGGVDYAESAVPTQFLSKYQASSGKWETVPVQHVGV